MGVRAHRGGILQRWLAVWFATLLAIAPFARPCLPFDLAAVPAAPEGLIAHDKAQGKHPAAELRPNQPLTLGIVSRLSLLDTMLGLPPLKPPPLRPVVGQPVPSLQAATVLRLDLRGFFQRSSVGTARTPTGPPA